MGMRMAWLIRYAFLALILVCVDGTLANQIEQGLALLSDGCSLLKVRAALFIGQDG